MAICWERAVLLALFRIARWPSAGKELSSWLFASSVLHLLPSNVFVFLSLSGCEIDSYPFPIIAFSTTCTLFNLNKSYLRSEQCQVLDRGFKFAKVGLIWSICPRFLKIPHENEILILTQNRIRANPLWNRHWVHMSCLTKPRKWMCAQWRLRSAWASAQSDQSSLCAQWVAKDPSFLHADSEDSDQTGRMPRLICVFAGRTVILLVLSRGGSYIEYFNTCI